MHLSRRPHGNRATPTRGRSARSCSRRRPRMSRRWRRCFPVPWTLDEARYCVRRTLLDSADPQVTLGSQLAEHGVAAILDIEGDSRPSDDDARSTVEHTPLTADERVKIVDSIRLAGQDADCDVTLLFDPIAAPIDAVDIHASLAGDAASNDAEVIARWRPRGLVILIRRSKVTMEEMAEIRLGVLGNVDSGKSSTLGVLTKGRLDDGRGRARVSLFRHKHEIETGRTSSIGLEIMGFSSRGDVVQVDSHTQATALTPKDANAHQGQAARRQALSWTQICSASCKVLSCVERSRRLS